MNASPNIHALFFNSCVSAVDGKIPSCMILKSPVSALITFINVCVKAFNQICNANKYYFLWMRVYPLSCALIALILLILFYLYSRFHQWFSFLMWLQFVKTWFLTSRSESISAEPCRSQSSPLPFMSWCLMQSLSVYLQAKENHILNS